MLYSKASPLPINKVLTFICQCLKDYTIFFRLLADTLEVTEDGAAGSDLVPGPRVPKGMLSLPEFFAVCLQ